MTPHTHPTPPPHPTTSPASPASPPETPTPRADRAERALWLVALGLAAALGARLATPGLGPSLDPIAHAGMAITGDRVAMLTADAGSDDVCAVLDDKREAMLIYRVNNPAGVELVGRADLPTLYRQARAGRSPRR